MNSTKPAVVSNYLIRGRETLALFADFTPLHEELDLHILSLDLHYDPLTLQLLKDGLSSLGLHLATRSPDEHVGWTVSLQDPRMNLFFVGNSEDQSLVGRAFVNQEEVEVREESLFIAQVKRAQGKQHQSFIEVLGVDLFSMAETYFRQSEQSVGRFFHQDSRVALLKGLPHADERWIKTASNDEVFALPNSKTEEARLLERRTFRFRCGCDRENIATTLLAAYDNDIDEIFGEDSGIEADCPRCGSRIIITRADFEELQE